MARLFPERPRSSPHLVASASDPADKAGTGDDPAAAFDTAPEIHRNALESLREGILPEHFRTAAQNIFDARRVPVFDVGPSSAMADGFAIQFDVSASTR